MSRESFLSEMGLRIAQCRKNLQMTQEQLAEQMGVSLQTISCIELGKKGIRPENLVNLCHCLDVNPDYILLGKRSTRQADELTSKLSALNEEEYQLVEHLVTLLYRNHEAD
ncbi:MAG: helix-turn-helix transcriptional regulator [Faecalimonas sp.]|nr:helix-turn-helix transcriptional regulator [Faecalimonas sp.]